MENEAFRRCTGGNLVETPNASSIGSLQLSAAPEITGTFRNSAFSGAKGQATQVTGCFTVSSLGNSVYSGSGGGSSNSLGTTELHASLASECYGRDAALEIRPTNYAAYTFIAY